MTASIPQLPLRDELFLLGHDDDTGQPHVHRRTLALGMAGAVLIDLFLAGRVTLDPNETTRPAPIAQLRLRIDRPVGDLIADTALASIRYAHPTATVKPWLRDFADDLYERTRAGLLAAGIMHHHTRRRLAGLIRADTYLPTDTKWTVVPAPGCATSPPDGNHLTTTRQPSPAWSPSSASPHTSTSTRTPPHSPPTSRQSPTSTIGPSVTSRPPLTPSSVTSPPPPTAELHRRRAAPAMSATPTSTASPDPYARRLPTMQDVPRIRAARWADRAPSPP